MSRRTVIHHRRLPAATTYRDRGFRPGDTLESEEWAQAKRIRSFDGQTVELATPQGSSSVSSFPPDVHKSVNL